MDPDSYPANLFKWDVPRGAMAPGPSRLLEGVAAAAASLTQPTAAYSSLIRASGREREVGGLGGGGLEELFQAYGIRYYTAAKISEMGFTMNTLLHMKDEELDDMMSSLSRIFRWDLLVGERYGIKAAIRAERRRLQDQELEARRRHHLLFDTNTTNGNNTTLDALSHEGLSEEPVQQEKEAAGSGGGRGTWEIGGGRKQMMRGKKKGRAKTQRRMGMGEDEEESEGGGGGDDEDDDDDDENGSGGGGGRGGERQREHPFIVTEPGEVARGKKNGLDYLFHLYEQCRDFLIQVQTIAKDRGEKCPTKVTNQVFRYAKKAGASYINKPKMRHYVHCYALHCLDEEASNALRRAFKERGENVGAWRQACYKPLVAIASTQGWDIDAIFNAHPRLSIWYVPTKLRQLCHAERSNTTTAASASARATVQHLPPF
nr:floricaula/leafy homolog [Gentiana triflora]